MCICFYSFTDIHVNTSKISDMRHGTESLKDIYTQWSVIIIKVCYSYFYFYLILDFMMSIWALLT